MKSRNQLLKELKQKYPKGWFKTSEDFDGQKGAIWSGECSYKDGIPLFEYYPEYEGIYEGGVLKELNSYLDKHGWYVEWYDAGTVMIYKQ